jgi:hypothetical protein
MRSSQQHRFPGHSPGMFASPPPRRASACLVTGSAVSDSDRTVAAVASLQHVVEPHQAVSVVQPNVRLPRSRIRHGGNSIRRDIRVIAPNGIARRFV